MNEIVLFSNGCPRCRIIEKKLEEKNVEYKKSESLQEIIEAGFLTVPILKVGEEYYDYIKAVKYLNER